MTGRIVAALADIIGRDDAPTATKATAMSTDAIAISII
jgi:hypothetical protein